MKQTIETRPLDDFELAYRARLEENRPVIELTAAVIRLTGYGERPVELERLAAELRWPVEDTRSLLQQWDWVMQLRDGLVHFDTFPPDPASGRQRRTIRIGGRVIDAGGGGCAPDLFAVVLWTGRPLQVESTCPATGERIVADLTPEGVSRVEPASAVLSLVDPRGPQFKRWQGGREAYLLICTQQQLYASAEAAGSWLAENPGGRLVPVSEFHDWMQRVFPQVEVTG